jgi:hypothetical protein
VGPTRRDAPQFVSSALQLARLSGGEGQSQDGAIAVINVLGYEVFNGA